MRVVKANMNHSKINTDGNTMASLVSVKQSGFSLIELLVVLVIMGMLAGLVGPRIFGNVDKAKVKTADTQVKMLKGSLQTYRLDVGSYPSTADGLNALVHKPQAKTSAYWQGPYLDDTVPLDPWGKPYHYELSGEAAQGFYLYTYGADGVQGGEGLNADVGYTQ